MNRRKALQSLGLATTHTLFPSILAGFVASCQNPAVADEDYSPLFFTQEELQAVKEIIDIILPATKSRSAAEVNTHHFLDEVFAKCMNPVQQAAIRAGLKKLRPEFRAATDKLAFLKEVDRKAYAYEDDYAYFRTIKQYTLVGFFTSQEGMTVASNYVQVPGDYQGEVPSDENTLNQGKTDMRYYL